MGGLKKDSKLALMDTFIIIMRRIVLLYVAMFVLEHPWLQASIFTSLSFLYLVYLLLVEPFEEVAELRLRVFNEYISLVISYLIMILNGHCYDGNDYMQVGNEITIILYCNWAVNGVIILWIAKD